MVLRLTISDESPHYRPTIECLYCTVSLADWWLVTFRCWVGRDRGHLHSSTTRLFSNSLGRREGQNYMGSIPNLQSYTLYVLVALLENRPLGTNGCWSFMSLQNLRLYQDGYRLVTVHTHGDFIVLPHWYPNQSYCPCPILLMPSTRLGSDKYQFYKSLV